MKKLSILLSFAALLFADLAMAQGAVVTSAAGTVQVQTGSAAARPLRQGDEVRQGDTVSTGAASSAVLKFDDGQVAALTANSRMTITAYQYNPQARTGNILLSLVNGGMRAITGLIGRNQPERVAYRAATATIGIRGTDTTVVTDGARVAVAEKEGTVTVTIGTESFTVTVGQAIYAADGRVTPGTAQQVLNALPLNLQNLVGQLEGMTALILAARVTRTEVDSSTTSTGTPGTNVAPSTTGGGTASPR